MERKIGFVGIGRMGRNMALRLKDCGMPLGGIYDSDGASAAALADQLRATHAKTLAEVTATADIIFTVVTDDTAQLAVFAQTGDSLLTAANGKIFVNCATIAPRTHVEIDRRAKDVGAYVLEACMASSIPQARSGQLYMMCGGDRDVFNRVSPVLEKLSSKIRYIGETGKAAKVKALVNMVMNANTAALAEGLGLGAALDLELDVLRRIFAETGAASAVLLTDGEDMENRNHECFFSASHAAKDSTIAWVLGVEAGLNLPIAAATKLQYDRLVALGLGHLDKSGIAEITFGARSGNSPCVDHQSNP